MRPTEEVQSLINCLTNDEDLRQDLWIHYLSGNPVESFARHLDKLRIEYSDDIELKRSIWFLVNNPPSKKLTELLDHFTDFEKSIICMLMLGLDIQKISAIKGIGEVRIRQAISAIRYNSIWSIYGIKERLNR